jgi:hypothetical protein
MSVLQTITVAACLAVCAGIVLAAEPSPARAEESKPSPKGPPAKTQPEKIVDGPTAAQQGKVRRPSRPCPRHYGIFQAAYDRVNNVIVYPGRNGLYLYRYKNGGK